MQQPWYVVPSDLIIMDKEAGIVRWREGGGLDIGQAELPLPSADILG